MWREEPLAFANGLALRGEWLYVAESFLPGVSRVHLCHPTNIAFRGSTLIAANLGRRHLTELNLSWH